MKGFLPPLVFFSVALSVSIAELLIDQNPCCGDHSISLKKNHFNECENGQKPRLRCEQGTAKVSHDFDLIFYDEDSNGKFMTAVSENYAFKVHSPYYCVANQTSAWDKPSVSVVYCTDRIIHIRDDSFDFDWRYLLHMTAAMLFIVSSLLLAVTAIIYFILPQTQYVEEKCTFHLTLNQSLYSLMVAFRHLGEHGTDIIQLSEYCLVHWYLFVFTLLSFLTWSALLAHHMWRKFWQHSSSSESNVMNLYLVVGYGIPALLVILSNIHIHWSTFSGSHDYYGGCYTHKSPEYTVIYVFLPTIAIQSACVYFFVSLHRKLWTDQPGNLAQYSISNMKKYKFRFVLNAKLLLVIGLPVVLFILCMLFHMLTGSFLVIFPLMGIEFFVSLRGIIIFYILVVRRKRILRGLVEKFDLSAEGWQPCPEEEPIEPDLENGTEQNREL